MGQGVKLGNDVLGSKEKLPILGKTALFKKYSRLSSTFKNL